MTDSLKKIGEVVFVYRSIYWSVNYIYAQYDENHSRNCKRTKFFVENKNSDKRCYYHFTRCHNWSLTSVHTTQTMPTKPLLAGNSLPLSRPRRHGAAMSPGMMQALPPEKLPGTAPNHNHHRNDISLLSFANWDHMLFRLTSNMVRSLLPLTLSETSAKLLWTKRCLKYLNYLAIKRAPARSLRPCGSYFSLKLQENRSF